MVKKRIDVSEYELAVLQVLWDRGPATIREISEQIYGDSSTPRYATVQKLLERLEKKKCVRRNRQSFAHTFAPKVEREDLIGHEIERLAEKLCGGSTTPLLIHLAEDAKLSDEERELLRRLIDESE